MNLAHRPTKVLITGKSGTGKSTYLEKYVLNSFQTIYNHILIFDHQGEFSYRLSREPSRTVEELERSLETGFTIFDPSGLFPGDTENAWNFFCEWSFQFAESNLQTGKKLLVCDEVQVMSSTSELPFELSLVIETGRRYQLDFVGVAQQLNLVHNRLRNQLTELVTFQQTDKLILGVLEEKGFDIEKVQRLKPGEFMSINFASGGLEVGRIDLKGNKRVDAQEGTEVNSPEIDE